MLKTRLIVFDMAGTTVKDNSEVLQCFQQAAAKTSLEASTEKVNAMMGLPKHQVFEVLWQEQIGLDNPDYHQKVETSYSQFKQILNEYYQTQPIEPTLGCLDMFYWLKSQGIKIALNTGFYREVTDIILNRLGWNRGLDSNYIGSENSLIQASITPSEIYNQEGRPAPFMIQKAMYKLGITNPQEVVAVGDTPSDLAAGKNAHCLMAIGVTSGTHSAQELAAHSHDYLINSLSELPAIIT